MLMTNRVRETVTKTNTGRCRSSLTRIKTPLCRLLCYMCRMNVVTATCVGEIIFITRS